MRTVLITGVEGFVGSHLAAGLAARGFRVSGSTSREASLRLATPGVARKVLLVLGGPCAPDSLAGADTVIHSAWDLRRGTASCNIAGTERLVEAAEAAGATHQVFISTYSAHPAAVTEYGKGKLAVQEYMLERGHTVVRPGLVVGPGGLYRRLAQTLAQRRVVPLVDGGRAAVPVVAISDFERAMADIVAHRRSGSFNLFNPEPVTLKALMLEIRAATPRRGVLVPVPAGLLLGPVWLMARIGLRLPIDTDNLRGLRANAGVRDRSDLTAFVPSPLTLAEMVRTSSRGRADS
jgi:nucleoside-diphosphate-sugar epimerase